MFVSKQYRNKRFILQIYHMSKIVNEAKFVGAN